MLWCEHCRGLISTRRDGDCFISCRGCGKVLLSQDVITSSNERTFVKSPGRRSRRAGSQSLDNRGPASKRAVNSTPAETSAVAAQQMQLKKHASSSKKKSKAIIIHDRQNPLTIEHESDMVANDFKLIQDYPNVQVGSGGGRSQTSNFQVGNVENVYDCSYDGDDDGDY